MKRITVVTGGSGLLGNALKKIFPDALYPTSTQMNLLDEQSIHAYFESRNPHEVIHLAGKVGGVKSNTEEVYDYYNLNSKINNNIINACISFNVPNLVGCLSTCAYPDESHVTYPLTEEQMHNGNPHGSNFGYAYAKRMMDVQLRAARQQYGKRYISVIPNNIYGEHDNFHLQNGHVLPALIRKIYEAKMDGKPFFEVWGDGEIYREFTYAEDIARIIMFCSETYTDPNPINIGCPEEYKLKDIISLICNILEYDGVPKYDASKPKGQIRKPSSNARLLQLGWDNDKYTSIDRGLRNTCRWFIKNYPHIRGIG